MVLGAGRRLARLARLDRLLRVKSFPLTVSLPWGINVGLVGLLPYLPLPTKLTTTILPPMRPEPGESVAEYAGRVHSAMAGGTQGPDGGTVARHRVTGAAIGLRPSIDLGGDRTVSTPVA
ncbi:MAG: hypothetical protein PGN29_18715 [Gordonia paraffinivorans]